MIKVKGPRVLVRQDKLEEVDPMFAQAAKAGIELPKEFKELRMEQNAIDKGIVVAIGDLAFQSPVGDGNPWCLVGDRVIFAKYAGSILKEKDEVYMILNDEDILGIILDA